MVSDEIGKYIMIPVTESCHPFSPTFPFYFFSTHHFYLFWKLVPNVQIVPSLEALLTLPISINGMYFQASPLIHFISFIPQPEEIQQQIVRETFHLVLKRDDNICNFLEGGR